MLLYNTERWQT